MSIITILLIVLVAFLAGMEGVLDEFQFHQPLVACTLIGLVSGHLAEGIMLGGSLQMIALGWANVGAAVAPDAALASVASAIIMYSHSTRYRELNRCDQRLDRPGRAAVRRRPVPYYDLPHHRNPHRPCYGRRGGEG